MKLKQALLHNTGWKMLAMLFTFLNNILIVRILGVEASANFFYAFAVFILLSTVLKFGLENGIVYFLSKKSKDTGAVTFLLFLVLIIQTIATIFLLKFFIKEAADFTLLWVILVVMGNTMLYYINAFYQIKKMFISLNVTSAIIIFLQSLLLLYLYYSPSNFLIKYKLASNNIDAMLLISGVAMIIQLILLIGFYCLKNITDFTNIKLDLNVTKNIFSYSLLNFVITVLFFLVMRLDMYFVEKYCNKIDLSNYLQAAKIGQMLLVFPGLVAGVIFPYTIEAPQVLAGKVAYLCRTITFLYLIIFITFLFTGRFIFTYMLGPDFNLMYEIFAISFFGVYCLSISLLFISYFEGINNQKIIIKAFLVTLIIIIITNYLFVPKYGYLAAAATFSIANFFGILVLLNAFNKETALKFNDTFLVKLVDIKFLKMSNN